MHPLSCICPLARTCKGTVVYRRTSGTRSAMQLVLDHSLLPFSPDLSAACFVQSHNCRCLDHQTRPNACGHTRLGTYWDNCSFALGQLVVDRFALRSIVSSAADFELPTDTLAGPAQEAAWRRVLLEDCRQALQIAEALVSFAVEVAGYWRTEQR